MDAETMLDQLAEQGDNAGADYNDEVNGWFGWFIDAGKLIIRFEGMSGDPIERTWTLTPDWDDD